MLNQRTTKQERHKLQRLKRKKEKHAQTRSLLDRIAADFHCAPILSFGKPEPGFGETELRLSLKGFVKKRQHSKSPKLQKKRQHSKSHKLQPQEVVVGELGVVVEEQHDEEPPAATKRSRSRRARRSRRRAARRSRSLNHRSSEDAAPPRVGGRADTLPDSQSEHVVHAQTRSLLDRIAADFHCAPILSFGKPEPGFGETELRLSLKGFVKKRQHSKSPKLQKKRQHSKSHKLQPQEVVVGELGVVVEKQHDEEPPAATKRSRSRRARRSRRRAARRSRSLNHRSGEDAAPPSLQCVAATRKE